MAKTLYPKRRLTATFLTPKLYGKILTFTNNADDAAGHLYGAIIASLRAYTESQKEGKYTQYHLAYCAHYIGDLSQPQHNTPHDGFNKIHHGANDGVVENEVMQKIDKIEKNMHPITLRTDHFEEDLAKEIARIANLARDLNDKLRKDNRNLSQGEAYRQLRNLSMKMRHLHSEFSVAMDHYFLAPVY